jgi:hypothetical protein
VPNGNNLHRNVIFRDGKAKADLVLPYSQYESIQIMFWKFELRLARK